jgi:hypothetical protein
MAIMIAEVYDALRDVGVSEEKARKAAEALAGYERDIASMRSDVRLLTWMSGLLWVPVMAILVKVFA